MRRVRGLANRPQNKRTAVEPVFGHIKECRGLRRLLPRGLDQVRSEWALLCTAHNLLKLAAARA